MGRPSKFTHAIADEICRRIADGESLRSVCRDSHIPDTETIRQWKMKRPEFLAQYVRAREDQADTDADRIKDIIISTLNGETNPLAARVAVDALKWIACKRNPKRYGDKIEHEVSGDLEVKLTIGGNDKAAS